VSRCVRTAIRKHPQRITVSVSERLNGGTDSVSPVYPNSCSTNGPRNEPELEKLDRPTPHSLDFRRLVHVDVDIRIYAFGLSSAEREQKFPAGTAEKLLLEYHIALGSKRSETYRISHQ
jgi:hypothetical protein